MPFNRERNTYDNDADTKAFNEYLSIKEGLEFSELMQQSDTISAASTKAALFSSANRLEECRQFADMITNTEIPLSNADNVIAEIMARVNHGNRPVATATYVGGKFIPPCHFGVVQNTLTGKVNIVSPGRWRLWSPYKKWLAVVKITNNLTYQLGNLSIASVPPGQLLKASLDGGYSLLAEGIHVNAQGGLNLDNKEFCDINNMYIKHGTKHLIRVAKGQVAKIRINNQPFIMSEGNYSFETPVLEFDTDTAYSRLTDHAITFDTKLFVRILQGNVGKLTIDGKSYLLPEGEHYFESNALKYDGQVALSKAYIGYNNKHRVRVEEGNCACIWVNKIPYLLPPGVHCFDTADFKIGEDFYALARNIIEHGYLVRFRVNEGDVALIEDGGNVQLLNEPGVYYKRSANFTLCEIKSVFQDIKLNTHHMTNIGPTEVAIVSDNQEGSTNGIRTVARTDSRVDANGVFYNNGKGPILCKISTQQKVVEVLSHSFLTQDKVEMDIQATLHFRIDEPLKAYRLIGDENVISKRMAEIATQYLTEIVAAQTYSRLEYCDSTQPAPEALSEEANTLNRKDLMVFGRNDAADAISRDTKALHDAFMAKATKAIYDEYGIIIENLRILKNQPKDRMLIEKQEEMAVTACKTQLELTTLAANTKLARAEQERKNEVERLKATQEIDIDLARARREQETKKLEAETVARVRTINTEAEVNAKMQEANQKVNEEKLKAEQQVNAKRLIAEQDIEYQTKLLEITREKAELYKDDTTTQQIALINVISDGLAASRQPIHSNVVFSGGAGGDNSASAVAPNVLTLYSFLQHQLSSTLVSKSAAEEIPESKQKILSDGTFQDSTQTPKNLPVTTLS